MPSSVMFVYLTSERWSCMDQDRQLFQTHSQQSCWQPCSDGRYHCASSDSGMWPHLWLWQRFENTRKLLDQRKQLWLYSWLPCSSYTNLLHRKGHYCVLPLSICAHLYQQIHCSSYTLLLARSCQWGNTYHCKTNTWTWGYSEMWLTTASR